MELKYAIGLSVQGSEHRRSQEFGLGANQKRKKVQSRGYMFQSLIQIFHPEIIKSDYLLGGSRDGFPRNSNVLIASAVKCKFLLGCN